MVNYAHDVVWVYAQWQLVVRIEVDQSPWPAWCTGQCWCHKTFFMLSNCFILADGYHSD